MTIYYFVIWIIFIDIDVCQIGTTIEYTLSYTRDATTYLYALKTSAMIKCIPFDARNTIWYCYAC